MAQDLFLEREELVRAHQLGELQKDYAIRSDKQIAIGGVCILLVLIILYASSAVNDITFIMITALVYPLGVGTVLGGWRYYHRRLRVYVYTGGLIYIKRNERKAVRWEQIHNVSRGGGMNLGWGRAVSIDWGGPKEPILHLTPLLDDIDRLYAMIKRGVDNHRRSGQEREQQEIFPLHCSVCNAELMAGAVVCERCGKLVAAGTAAFSTEEDNPDDRPAPFTLASPANGPSATPSDPGQLAFADPQQPTASPGEHFGSGPPMSVSPGQQPGSNAGQYPPQPGYASASFYQGTIPATPPQPPRRRGRWIIWGASAALVVIGLVLLGVMVSVNGSTPSKTLNGFCSALKSGDYQAAYHQFSSSLQSQHAEAQFADGYVDAFNLGLGKITNCTVTNVTDAAGSGTVSATFASESTVVDDVTLVNQSGTWKINSYQPRSSPTLTLLLLCSALKSENYPIAYNQLSRRRHRQITEAQFAHLFIPDPVTNCMVSNVNDTAGTGSISFTYADGSSTVRDYTLIDEHGAWKINRGRLHP